MDRVLIADYHPVTAEGISTLLSEDNKYKVIGSVNDGNDILKFLVKNEANILILEIDIPNLNSISIIKSIKKEFPHIKVLIFSCLSEEMYALSTIKYGAVGYIPKTVSSQQLTEAINQVQKGGIYLTKNISDQLITDRSTNKKTAFEYRKLSTREEEVLNQLSDGKRNIEIAEALKISNKTVSTYKARLLKKLNAQNVTELIHRAKILQEPT